MTHEERIEAMARALADYAGDDYDFDHGQKEVYVGMALATWAAADVEGVVREAAELAAAEAEFCGLMESEIDAIVKRVMEGAG
jgi:hypothetical protein